MCLEELMDTPTFKRFNTALDGVLEAAEDMDLASIRGVCSISSCGCPSRPQYRGASHTFVSHSDSQALVIVAFGVCEIWQNTGNHCSKIS